MPSLPAALMAIPNLWIPQDLFTTNIKAMKGGTEYFGFVLEKQDINVLPEQPLKETTL